MGSSATHHACSVAGVQNWNEKEEIEDSTFYVNQLSAWFSVIRLQRNTYSLFAEVEKCLINMFCFLSS